jgi:TolA-binding protein
MWREIRHFLKHPRLADEGLPLPDFTSKLANRVFDLEDRISEMQARIEQLEDEAPAR